MTKIKTIIKPQMITWARKRLNMSVVEFAEKMKVDPSSIHEWENGITPISMKQAELLAKASLVPLGMLFLKEVPRINLSLPDFRAIGNVMVSNPSPELEATILEMQEKQEWMRDFRLENNEGPLPYIGSINLSTKINGAVSLIRQVLHISEDDIGDNRNWESYFGFIIDAIENAGILFVRNGVVGKNTRRQLDIEEFRGFALVDDYAPLVFINGADSKNAQLFTVVHEVVHIFLGKGGVSNVSMTEGINNRIECFCNQVSGEFLAPEKIVIELWTDALGIEENLKILARALKVSKFVVLYRLRDLELITKEEFQCYWQQESRNIRHQTASGGNFYATLKYKVSRTLAQMVISESLAYRIPFGEAFQLVGVKNMGQMMRLAQEIGMPL